MYFASDNSGPVSDEILDALRRANVDFTLSYGSDALTKKAQHMVREKFEAPTAAVFFVATGSAANVLALSTLGQPWQTIYCTEHAHIHKDECAAPEFFGGNKLTIVSSNDKIQSEELYSNIRKDEYRGVHGVQRGPISITQTTEKGSIYSLDELRTLTKIAKEFNLPIHMDGARLANALVALDCTPAEMTWKLGIDAVSLGGTKNGCLQLEAVIFFDPSHGWEFELRRKRGAHLICKHRFLAAQMIEYLKNDLWLHNARLANSNALYLANGLQDRSMFLEEMPKANMVFASMPRSMHKHLINSGATYYLWDGALDGPENELITGRFVCDWSISRSQIDEFLDLL
ncbi:MAG: beta-eliminating lyase-related protein [Aestuariivita sp.]|nr:beta-eliminating lyase-related protein [Aestuariivita sp.]